MIPALVAALSAVGLAAAAWLWRLPAWEYATDLAPYADDPDVVRLGYVDTTGLVD